MNPISQEVIMTLSKTYKRPCDIRVVATVYNRQYSGTPIYSVEVHNDSDNWTIEREWTTEQEALQDAINWYK